MAAAVPKRQITAVQVGQDRFVPNKGNRKTHKVAGERERPTGLQRVHRQKSMHGWFARLNPNLCRIP